jgi:intracellular sulfur oxidation DsrE/DsrF family protein
MFKVKTWVLAFSLAVAGVSGAAVAQQAAKQPLSDSSAKSAHARAIYHINDSSGQALSALRNLRNHLDVDPDAELVVVAHADGIDFLMTDYKEADTVGPLVSGLASRGVKFEVCEITMKRKGVSPDAFVLETTFVPSGVVRLTELQNKQGYAYLKP